MLIFMEGLPFSEYKQRRGEGRGDVGEGLAVEKTEENAD